MANSNKPVRIDWDDTAETIQQLLGIPAHRENPVEIHHNETEISIAAWNAETLSELKVISSGYDDDSVITQITTYRGERTATMLAYRDGANIIRRVSAPFDHDGNTLTGTFESETIPSLEEHFEMAHLRMLAREIVPLVRPHIPAAAPTMPNTKEYLREIKRSGIIGNLVFTSRS